MIIIYLIEESRKYSIEFWKQTHWRQPIVLLEDLVMMDSAPLVSVSASFLAELSVISPQKLFIFII